jgi:hypothetical protein
MRRSLLAVSCPLIALTFAGLTACNNSQQTAEETTGNPADGNLAPASEATPGYAPAPSPQAEYPEGYYPPAGGAYEQPVEAQEAPPPLPEYTQPPCPGDNYIWTPGYWAWSSGYYWVPGAWVVAPWVGALWTPPWWGYQNNVYIWYAGYWAPHIGFYGGIDYGFGYPGRGYYGAYWNQGRIYYNRQVTNVNITVVHNYYEAPVPRVQVTRISYNGGPGGIEVRPTRQELALSRYPRLAPVPAQVEHAQQAVTNRAQFAGAGNQRPKDLAATLPLATKYKAPEARPPEAAVRVAERPAPTAPRPASEAARPTPEARRALPPAQPTGGPAEQRPAPPERAGNQPAPEIRRPVPEQRPAQAERTTPTPRPELPARPEQPRAVPQRPEAPTRPEQPRAIPPRPVPQARPETHAVAPRPEQPARPQAQPQRAAPPRPEPQARPEQPRAPAPRPATPEEKRKDER